MLFLEANHCPGAAMVLARPPSGAPAVLHTGDARLTREATQSCPHLQSAVGRVQLVLDTTYAGEKEGSHSLLASQEETGRWREHAFASESSGWWCMEELPLCVQVASSSRECACQAHPLQEYSIRWQDYMCLGSGLCSNTCLEAVCSLLNPVPSCAHSLMQTPSTPSRPRRMCWRRRCGRCAPSPSTPARSSCLEPTPSVRAGCGGDAMG